jgi:hypothetical protein
MLFVTFNTLCTPYHHLTSVEKNTHPFSTYDFIYILCEYEYFIGLNVHLLQTSSFEVEPTIEKCKWYKSQGTYQILA